MNNKTKSSPSFPVQNASEIDVKSLVIWYHFPFAVLEDVDLRNEWKSEQALASFQQTNYFHPYVTRALWANPSDEKSAPLFDRLTPTRPIVGNAVYAYVDHFLESTTIDKEISTPDHQEVEKRLGGDTPKQRKWYKGKVFEVELRHLLPSKTTSEKDPGIAILIVGVKYDGMSTEIVTDSNQALTPPKTFTALTLAASQQILNRSRRAFPTWFKDASGTSDKRGTMPGDSFSGILGHGVSPNGAEVREKHSNGEMPLMPWVAELVAPFTLDGKQSKPFGDERSYISSCVVIGDGLDTGSVPTIESLHPSDLFRLAEVDGDGDGYCYQKPFLDKMKEDYFYDRHTRDPDTQTGNTTQFLLSQHHLCAVGSGAFTADFIANEDPLLGHLSQYYRHMQFLCVFEYFRLLQFSQQLTALVQEDRRSRETGDETVDDHRYELFASGLYKIRQDFLDFTHLHHFSNISSQLQPREMFEKLYSNFGITEMFHEVEQELNVATEFLTMRLEQKSQRSSEKLNNLLSIGVPLSLIVGAGGMNIFLGSQAPIFLGGGLDGPIPWYMQLAQLFFVVGLTGGIWAFASNILLKKSARLWVLICVFSFLGLALSVNFELIKSWVSIFSETKL